MPMRFCFVGSLKCQLVIVWLAILDISVSLNDSKILLYKEKAKEMFYHGMNGYLKYGFPLDELKPLSCTGAGLDHLQQSIQMLKRNSLPPPSRDSFLILSGVAMTLIDSMDTLVFMDDPKGFHQMAKLFLNTVPSFDIDNTVLVFELNIRVLGGLLSCHLFLAGLFDFPEADKFKMKGYRGELLELAKDLGKRLLPAFNSPTGIPYSKINLRRGLEKKPNASNCPAAGGTFILEFGLLSILASDPIYYNVAKKALKEIWKRRSSKNLIGYEIDVETGEWLDPASTIGAGSDSFYEYLLKGYIMFGDDELLQMSNDSMSSIDKNMLDPFRVFYKTVHFESGSLRTDRIDALGAFYPGLQTLRGDIESARRAFDGYYLMMKKHGGFLPECVSVDSRITSGPSYNLRPELAESAYYLYQATKDPFYLRVGAEMLDAIDRYCRSSCGFAVVDNLFEGILGDRMESFLLSETLKYLYLLFSTDHWVNKLDRPAVFTTGTNLFEANRVNLVEAHLLMVPRKLVSKLAFKSSDTFRCRLVDKEESKSSRKYEQRLLAHWLTASKSQTVDEFQNIWNWGKLDRVNFTPALDLTVFETEMPIQHYMVYLNGNLYKFSTMNLQPWLDLRQPGYVVSQLGKDIRLSGERVVLVQRRNRTASEALLSATIGSKRYPLQMNSHHLDQCHRYIDPSKTPKLLGLFSMAQQSYQDMNIPPGLWKAYFKTQRTGLIGLECGKESVSHFSVADVIEAFSDQHSESVLNFANLPVNNLHLIKVPDYIYDQMGPLVQTHNP